MTVQTKVQRLADAAPDLERVLTRGTDMPPQFGISEIQCKTAWVSMRDGVRLATDLYIPPKLPAPVIARRTPYGRAQDKFVAAYFAFACRGYIVVSQDCRGTGDSEPEAWDYYMYEAEDGVDLAQWVSEQSWFGGFLGTCGGSYVGQTQWCMALHPSVSTIVPEVSGLGVATNTTHLYMSLDAYARSVGKGEGTVSVHHGELERLIREETLSGGYFNEPLHPGLPAALLARYPELRTLQPAEGQRWLWEHYCALSGAQRSEFVRLALGTDRVSILEVEALPALFGQRISHDAHSLPHTDRAELCRMLHAAPLMVTGWYDWALNDALETWTLLRREARKAVASRSRLIIAPNAHNALGYREDMASHPELQRVHRLEHNAWLPLHWYAAVREDSTASWPTVIYYLMGANEWQVAADWPPADTHRMMLHLRAGGGLTVEVPREPSPPDRYVYDPTDPTPTVGGSIVSHVLQPGGVDVSQLQQRSDVLTYTTAPLEDDLDVVGPLELVLYASSSAVDTDFAARLSDVFPDGRAIQLQSGILRARYRDRLDEPELLEPGKIYRFRIDLWATANRFKSGHRVRVDISSADFPRFDRNTNLGGELGPPVKALQRVYHDPERPSHLVVSVLNRD